MNVFVLKIKDLLKNIPLICFWGISLFIVFNPLIAKAETVDLILYNGKVTTLDPQNPMATSVAIKGGRILKVGSDTDVLELKGNTAVIRRMKS